MTRLPRWARPLFERCVMPPFGPPRAPLMRPSVWSAMVAACRAHAAFLAPREECLRNVKPLYAHTLLGTLIRPVDMNSNRHPSCAALRYMKCEAVFTVDNFLVMKRRSPRPSTCSPRRQPTHPRHIRRDIHLSHLSQCARRRPRARSPFERATSPHSHTLGTTLLTTECVPAVGVGRVARRHVRRTLAPHA